MILFIVYIDIYISFHQKITFESINIGLKITSLLSAEVAVPLASGSNDRSTSTRAKAEGGKFLNVSARERL